MTINEKIKSCREELNFLISTNANYDDIYKLSTYIDSLIIKFYNQNKNNNKFDKKVF